MLLWNGVTVVLKLQRLLESDELIIFLFENCDYIITRNCRTCSDSLRFWKNNCFQSKQNTWRVETLSRLSVSTTCMTEPIVSLTFRNVRGRVDWQLSHNKVSLQEFEGKYVVSWLITCKLASSSQRKNACNRLQTADHTLR